MSRVLFLAAPSHGHVNPTVGLVDALVRRGEQVTYFASAPFRERIEAVGATFRAYAHDLDLFKGPPPPGGRSALVDVVARAPDAMADVLAQAGGERFDYLVHSAPFLLARPLAQRLALPRVASHAVFLGLEALHDRTPGAAHPLFGANPERDAVVAAAAHEIGQRFGVPVSTDFRDWIVNPGALNLAYTSRLFAGDLPWADASWRFVGPPIHARHETHDFPLHALDGRRVLYISLGTVFGDRCPRLYPAFFEAFAAWDGVVVMSAFGVDTRGWRVPANFIVRPYVPQAAILQRATAAITHAGMNSLSDILAAEVPVVCLPLGADQPALASRAHALGAALVLDPAHATAADLARAVERVTSEPSFRAAIRVVADSFRDAGGYPRAADAVMAFKRAHGID